MKLPNAENAIIPSAKITEYLLDIYHEEGAGKAKFFIYFGFSLANWGQLATALRRHCLQHEVSKVENTSFGTRYVVEGGLETPINRFPLVRVVWFILNTEQNPRLVTAYPLEQTDD